MAWYRPVPRSAASASAAEAEEQAAKVESAWAAEQRLGFDLCRRHDRCHLDRLLFSCLRMVRQRATLQTSSLSSGCDRLAPAPRWAGMQAPRRGEEGRERGRAAACSMDRRRPYFWFVLVGWFFSFPFFPFFPSFRQAHTRERSGAAERGREREVRIGQKDEKEIKGDELSRFPNFCFCRRPSFLRF